MKILQVYPIFNPQDPSGAAKVAYAISKELAKRGHEVVFYASDMKNKYTRGACGTVVADGIEVHRLKTVWPILSRKLKIFFTPSLMSISGDELQKFDVVHLHAYRSYQNIAFYFHCKRKNIPYVVQAHGTLPASPHYKQLKITYDALFGYKLLRDASKCLLYLKKKLNNIKRWVCQMIR